MLSIRHDAATKTSEEYVVEVTKKSYPDASGYDSGKRNYDDEGAADLMRYRVPRSAIKAFARECIKHLPAEEVDGLAENRLFRIFETTGFSIPWGYDAIIRDRSILLVKREK